MKVQPIIMAGGNGSRIWPLSRQLLPKQFLPLSSVQSTMLQDTIRRLDGVDTSPPSIICNKEHRFLAAEQMRQAGILNSTIILEPAGRNTAPAIALSALQATNKNEDPILLVLAADHLIQDNAAFHHSIKSAIGLAESGKLITFGIVPNCPETGYGYIQRGNALTADAFEVAAFEEKPDLATATRYLESGEYYWNSGMFIFKASQYINELEKYRPDILTACRQAMKSSADQSGQDFIQLDEDAFMNCPSESIDYAVMEQTSNAGMVPLDAGWNDIGSWSSLWDVSKKDGNNNSLDGDVISHNTSDSLIRAEHRLVATVGVQNLTIVETKDAVLIANKDDSQDVKLIVDALTQKERSEHISHTEVFRPWGKYESLDHGEKFQVKRITVKPGAKLSVQMHHQRAEHWIVVKGIAQVTNGEKTFTLRENESTYIPKEQIHALENTGETELELIEVQFGDYLGEDDIVRFEDRYGRA